MIQINYNEQYEPTSGLYVSENETEEVEFEIVNNVALVPAEDFRERIVSSVDRLSVIKEVKKACKQHKWNNDWTNVTGDEVEVCMSCAECGMYKNIYADLEGERAEVYEQ